MKLAEVGPPGRVVMWCLSTFVFHLISGRSLAADFSVMRRVQSRDFSLPAVLTDFPALHRELVVTRFVVVKQVPLTWNHIAPKSNLPGSGAMILMIADVGFLGNVILVLGD